jgi:hypothetical protein
MADQPPLKRVRQANTSVTASKVSTASDEEVRECFPAGNHKIGDRSPARLRASLQRAAPFPHQRVEGVFEDSFLQSARDEMVALWQAVGCSLGVSVHLSCSLSLSGGLPCWSFSLLVTGTLTVYYSVSGTDGLTLVVRSLQCPQLTHCEHPAQFTVNLLLS